MWVPSKQLLGDAMRLLNSDTIPVNRKLNGSFLGFLVAPLSLTLNTTFGDVSASLATPLGYGLAPLTWSGPFNSQGGYELLSGGGNVVERTGSDTATNLYGQVILGSDSVTYIAGELFDAPRPVSALGDGFVTNPLLGMGPNNAGYGNSIVSN